MSNRKNLKSARAYRSPTGGWKLDVTFQDGVVGNLKSNVDATYQTLEDVAIEIGNTNLKEFAVEV
ncbi:MAG TPA: hypothetical protein VIM41_10235 [Gammaproteobacteria bacterium]